MPSHVNIVTSGVSAAKQYEEMLNREAAAPHPGQWRGVDTRAPKLPASKEYLDRLEAAARERGRPLTAEENEKIIRGETLPPVVKPVTVKSLEARITELEAQVAEFQKVPVALRGIEKRGR